MPTVPYQVRVRASVGTWGPGTPRMSCRISTVSLRRLRDVPGRNLENFVLTEQQQHHPHPETTSLDPVVEYFSLCCREVTI
jgi:hypothetical protein